MYSILCDVFSINSDLHVVVKYRDTMHTNALLGALVNVYTNWTLFQLCNKKKLLYTRETVLNAWLTLLSPTLVNRSNIYHDNYDYKCIFWVFYVSNNNQQNHIRQNCINVLYILFDKINYIRKNTMFLFCEFVMSHAGKVGDYLKLVTIYIFYNYLFI